MEPEDPGRHFSSGRHRPDAVSPAAWPLPGPFGSVRPPVLTAAAAVLALISATTFYIGVQAGVPADAVAPPGLPASVPAEQHLPAVAAPPSTAAPSPAPAAVVPAAAVPRISPELDARINAVISANSRYQVGVALIDVTDGLVHEYGVKTKFVAASTAKILAAVSYYHLVETGRASLGTRMGVSTAGVQIRQMVQQSNNESWALIMGAVGQSALTGYAASIGIDYDRRMNTLTPAETARTLHLLYSGQLLNAENTAQLLSYMQNTNYEALIPAAVPAGISVFHKYGLLFGNLHDASILAQGERAYVFVVYTQGRDTSDMAARTRVIHQLTRAVTAGLF